MHVFMKKNIRNFLIVSIALLMLAASFYVSTLRKQNIDGHVSEVLSDEDADYGKAMELASKTSVQVKASSLMGSGNIYRILEDRIVIVTALHIFGNGEDEGTVVFDDGSSVRGRVVKRDPDKDICFLETAVEGEVAGKVRNNEIKSICSISEIYFNEAVFVYDPYEKAMSAGSVASNSMFIEEFGMDMIYCLCDVSEGMSGSGLFTTRGYYAGMLLGGSSDSEAVCVDVETIKEVYESP